MMAKARGMKAEARWPGSLNCIVLGHGCPVRAQVFLLLPSMSKLLNMAILLNLCV
jgi:hypothetical protein